MNDYLLIESRDPFESNEVAYAHELARRLTATGSRVTLFLVENGVLPARPCARSAALTELAEAGVEVLADAFALRERGIAADRLTTGVTAAPLDVVIERLATGWRALWHA